MIRKTTPWQIGKRFLFLSLCCIAMVLPTAAQKKPVQKRDKFEYSFELPVFVEKLKRELTYPLAWGNSDIKNFDRWRTEVRKKVFECMMAPPRPAAAFDMRVEEEEKREGYTAKRISFCINDYARVTAYLLVPDGDGPFPAINALHDHGAHLYIGKEKMVRPFGVEQEVIDDANQWAAQLYEGQFVGDFMAQHGYVVLSVDAPLWGERGREEGVDRSKYDIIAGNMMMLGRDLCAFMHYDDIYATDFLSTLPCVDRNRIGCLGCSMGAYRAWMLAALTDRVKAAASVCWMTTTDVQMSTADRKKEISRLPSYRQHCMSETHALHQRHARPSLPHQRSGGGLCHHARRVEEPEGRQPPTDGDMGHPPFLRHQGATAHPRIFRQRVEVNFQFSIFHLPSSIFNK